MANWFIFSRQPRYIKKFMNIFLFKQQHVNIMLCMTYDTHSQIYSGLY